MEYVSLDPSLSSSSDVNGSDPRISIVSGGSGYGISLNDQPVSGGSGTGMRVDYEVKNTISITDTGAGFTSNSIDVPVITLTGIGDSMTVDFNISEDTLTKAGVGYTSDGVHIKGCKCYEYTIVLTGCWWTYNITKDVLVTAGNGYDFTGTPVTLVISTPG